MENLVSKSITFEGLLSLLNHDEDLLFNFIMNLKNQDAKTRLCDEAREYYAEYFNIKKEDVWYGDLIGNQIPNPFPYTHMIGNLKCITDIDMTKLVYLDGNLKDSFIEEYPNLETITGTGDFQPRFFRSKLKRLPKLKRVKHLFLSYTPIEDIHSLEKVDGNLGCVGTHIKYVNPNLEIMGMLQCEKSHNFEEFLDKRKKHNWWYTDNPNIL